MWTKCSNHVAAGLFCCGNIGQIRILQLYVSVNTNSSGHAHVLSIRWLNAFWQYNHLTILETKSICCVCVCVPLLHHWLIPRKQSPTARVPLSVWIELNSELIYINKPALLCSRGNSIFLSTLFLFEIIQCNDFSFPDYCCTKWGKLRSFPGLQCHRWLTIAVCFED